MTDDEWTVLEPFFPPPSHVGRPGKWPLRRIVEAILYLLRGGLPWWMLPPCFPPVSTVRRWFYLRRDNGLPASRSPPDPVRPMLLPARASPSEAGRAPDASPSSKDITISSSITRFSKHILHKLHDVEQRLYVLKDATEKQADQADEAIDKHVATLEDYAHKATPPHSGQGKAIFGRRA